MTKYIIFLLLTFSLGIESCRKSNDSLDSSTSTDQDLDSTGNLVNHELASDYVWNNSDIVTIQLNETSATADNAGVSIAGSTVTINTPGTYQINGSLSNGQIVVNTTLDGVVRLILNGVTISNSSSAPVFIAKAEKTILILPDNTISYLSDAATYVYASVDDDEPNAAVFSKGNLTIYGNGSLHVTGNYNDAVSSKDGLVIRDATIALTSVDDGIRGKDYLVVYNGKITASVKGDGFKSDNDAVTSRGFISILDGVINITSGKDAISAATDVLIAKGTFNIASGGGSTVAKSSTVSTKGIKGLVSVVVQDGTFTISSADDAVHSNKDVTIQQGTFSIASSDDGLHADGKLIINNGNITITKSKEAIEAGLITVNNGNISITASDDGFNASYGNGGENNDGSCLTMNGGTVYVNASGGDGLDSNGNMVIAGGVIVVHGPQSQPEVGLDYNGTCNVTGGFLVISGPGSNMTQSASTSSSQYSLKLLMTSSVAANTIFHIQDAAGNDLITFKPVRSFTSILFSSPSLKNGSTYYVYTGGSSTGTVANGLYTGGSYTAGTQYTSFTISSIVTSLGSSSSGTGGGRF